MDRIFNLNFDINAKCNDMMNVSKRIIEHYEFVSDGSCEPPMFVCLAYDVKNYLPKLLKENQQLKEQLQQKEDIINKVREYCDFGVREWTTDDGFVEEVLKRVKEILDNKEVNNG